MPQETKTASSKLDTWKLRAYTVWAAIGFIILLGGVLYVLGMIYQAVAVVIISGLLVFMLHGMVNAFERMHIPRIGGALLSLIIVFVVIFGCFALFVPTMVDQLTELSRKIPGYLSRLQSYVSEMQNDSQTIDLSMFGISIDDIISQARSAITTTVTSTATAMAGGVIGSVVSVGEGFLIAFISIVVALWVLADLPKIGQEIRLFFRDDQQSTLDLISQSFGDAIYGWAKSTLISAIVTGILTGVVFFFAGIPYSAILGFACGVLYIIPYIGPAISYVLCGALALTVSSLTCVEAVIISVVAHEIVANFISPRLMKNTCNVHPALVMVVIMVGQGLGGVVGMLAAIPVAAALQTIFVTLFEAHTGKELYSVDGALFHKVDEKKVTKSIQKAGDTLTNLHLPKK